MIFDVIVIALLVVGCLVGWHKGIRKLALSWAEIIVFAIACALLIPGAIKGFTTGNMVAAIWRLVVLVVVIVGLIVFYFWSRRRLRINFVRKRAYRNLDRWLGLAFALVTFFLLLGVVLGCIAMIPDGEVIAILPEANPNTGVEFTSDPLLDLAGIKIPAKTIYKIENIGETLRTQIAGGFFTKIVYKLNWLGHLLAGRSYVNLP
ncbi:MAG: CvpA family protein [Clostridia bacterium]|nr:CvpA family protein [Clostridia bacterium]